MLTTNKRILCTLSIFTMGVLTASAQQLQNEAYAIKVENSNQIRISKEGAGSVPLSMTFCVLYRADNPKAKMANSAEDVNYPVIHWSRPAGDADAAEESNKGTGKDFNSVGDGFDPRVLGQSKKGLTANLFHAAPQVYLDAENVKSSPGKLTFRYPEHPYASLRATLSLPEGDMPPVLEYEIRPNKDGYYSIGYMGAPDAGLDDIEEIWQPLIWQEKRFPKTSYMTLAYRCPIPTTLVARNGVTVGIVADPTEFPFSPLPREDNSRFGVAVRNRKGLAQAMLFASVLGLADSKMTANDSYSFKLRPVIVKGNTTDAFEHIARSLYDFHDYRSNALCSLNTTLENMIDYGMSKWSRFSEELKGCDYSTDAPGATKNVSSLNPLEMAIVTDDEEIFRRRAYPIIEYMLSRGKFLFSTDRRQKIQSPSYTLNGPCAPISELTALYDIFHRAPSALLKLAKQEYGSKRILNLNATTVGKTWPNALAIYRVTGDKTYLDFAKEEADAYIEKRINSPATDFNDPMGASMFFWTQYTPRFADLLELYEATGEERYLNAAHRAARLFTQAVWISPRIPDKDILVNKGGQAPLYYYLRNKGHKRMYVPEETVPAWRLSAIGLTPESSGTSAGHRAIFMANYAPWLIRIGYLTNDDFLEDIGRSAIIGRYRNFPGYHINTARTAAYEKEDYPLRPHKELSVNSFHYNHIWPMMSMLLDYLVTQAHVRSDGAIEFPSQFIEGYAYLQNKFYGHEEGQFYDADDAILWMPKQLLEIDNIEVNYIAARGRNDLYLALMNEDDKPINATVTLDKQRFAGAPESLRLVSETGRAELRPGNGTFTVEIPARGLTAVVLEGAKAKPVFQAKLTGTTQADNWKKGVVEIDDPAGKAMILNLGRAAKTAYVFLEDGKDEFTQVDLAYDIGAGAQTMTDREFPWEFTVPLDPKTDRFVFTVSGRQKEKDAYSISGAKAHASSKLDNYSADKAVDGKVSDTSRWVSARDQDGPSWLEIELPQKQILPGIRLYSGYQNRSAVSNLHLEFKENGRWRKIPGTTVEGNDKIVLDLPFNTDKQINTDALRLVFPHEKDELVRVKEVQILSTGKDIPRKTSQTYELQKREEL